MNYKDIPVTICHVAYPLDGFYHTTLFFRQLETD